MTEYVLMGVVTILLFLFVTSSMVQAYVVPTGSMENNILVGDHMLVDKVGFENGGNNWASYVLPHREVKRGDIIAFRYPEDVRQTYVKRVIGVPGDHIHLVNKKVFLNGKAVDDSSYAIHHPPPGTPEHVPPDYMGQLAARDYFGPFTVPPASYFCMGDNRDNSWDSRFWGELPATYVLGRAFAIYWSKGGQDFHLGFETSHFLDGFAWPDKKFRFKPDWAAYGPRGKEMPTLPDHFDVIDNATADKPFRMVAAPARTFLNSTFTETPSSQKRD